MDIEYLKQVQSIVSQIRAKAYYPSFSQFKPMYESITGKKFNGANGCLECLIRSVNDLSNAVNNKIEEHNRSIKEIEIIEEIKPLLIKSKKK